MKKWYQRLDGTLVYKVGRFKVFEISEMPHGSYCCQVFNKGKMIASEGYHGTSLRTLNDAVQYGKSKIKIS